MDIAPSLIERATREQYVRDGKLVLHAANGGPMTARPRWRRRTNAQPWCARIIQRPRVSDDNPYAVAQLIPARA
jgi:hypothetical protein